jgi:hypothetical protein
MAYTQNNNKNNSAELYRLFDDMVASSQVAVASTPVLQPAFQDVHSSIMLQSETLVHDWEVETAADAIIDDEDYTNTAQGMHVETFHLFGPIGFGN